MENTGGFAIFEEYKKLLALNSSLAARLEDYGKTIKGRDNDIEILRAMLTESGAYRSSLDTQVNEFRNLQQNIMQLQQQVEGSTFVGTPTQRLNKSSGTEHQLEDLRLQYTYLQTQLTDVQTQLQAANNRNLLLQQQTVRIAELESLLENAEEELSKWKKQPNPALTIAV